MGIPTRSETALKMNMLIDHLCSHHDDQLVSLPGFLRFVTAFITARNKVEKAEDGSTKSPPKRAGFRPYNFRSLRISTFYNCKISEIINHDHPIFLNIFLGAAPKKIHSEAFSKTTLNSQSSTFWDVSCAIGRES